VSFCDCRRRPLLLSFFLTCWTTPTFFFFPPLPFSNGSCPKPLSVLTNFRGGFFTLLCWIVTLILLIFSVVHLFSPGLADPLAILGCKKACSHRVDWTRGPCCWPQLPTCRRGPVAHFFWRLSFPVCVFFCGKESPPPPTPISRRCLNIRSNRPEWVSSFFFEFRAAAA